MGEGPRRAGCRRWCEVSRTCGRAKEGAGTSHDMYDRMLPLGETLEPSLAIEAALTHIRPRKN